MKYLIYFILFFTLSCSSKRQKYFSEFKQDVNPAIFDKFPLTEKEICENDELLLLFPAGIEAINYCGLRLVKRISSESLENELKDLSIRYKRVGIDNDQVNLKLLMDNNSIVNNNILDTYFVSKDYLKNINTAFLINSKKGNYTKLPVSSDNLSHGYYSMILIDTVNLKKIFLIKIW
ncbi:MAG: hypothetical protein WAT22_12155 [Saprospiraceae bacterium]|jgi:hypothetical protein|nr:hypothetical protein [Saprospiraceae bacterium]MBP6447181.1 hypothetical protein [Saprospiraceae bacterium]